MLTEGNKKLIIDMKINLSKVLKEQNSKTLRRRYPLHPLVSEKLCRNSIFYVKTVGAQSVYNNPY